MSELFLDLHDKARVVDFLAEQSELASPKERSMAEDMVESYHLDPNVPTTKLAGVARALAIATWPARFALERHFHKEGSSDEWARVTAAVRPSTAFLLKRFRQGTTAQTLDEVLKHDDSDMAFKEGERYEIDQVRHQLRQDFWRDKRKVLDEFVKEGEMHMQAYAERLGALRELAPALPSQLTDEVYAKLAHYEDRILYRGEMVPLEILDQEVAYYTEQKELSPME